MGEQVKRAGPLARPSDASDPFAAAVRLSCWACVTAGAGLAFFGAGMAAGGDALGCVLACAGALVGAGGVAGAVVEVCRG